MKEHDVWNAQFVLLQQHKSICQLGQYFLPSSYKC
jgi:hypothetical protein